MLWFTWNFSIANINNCHLTDHFKFIYLFIYFWLCWVFVSVRGLSLVAVSGGHSWSRCAGLSLSWPLLLRSTGSRRVGSVDVAHGLSCSAACGIFPDQGSNPCPLHWQADSQPLHHQGSPWLTILILSVLKSGNMANSWCNYQSIPHIVNVHWLDSFLWVLLLPPTISLLGNSYLF